MAKRKPKIDRSDCPGIVKSGRNKGRPMKRWTWAKGHRCPVLAKRVADIKRYKAGGCAVPAEKAYDVGFKKGAATCGLNGVRPRRRRGGRR